MRWGTEFMGEKKPERLVVIVPCLNEGKNIEATAADVLEEAPLIPMELEVRLVDDGSKDDTLEKMERISRQDSRFKVIRHDRNRGVGYTWLEGINSVDPDDWVTGIAGDNEMVFKSIHAMLAMRKDYDLVLGYFQNPIVRTLTRRVASELFVSVTNFAYGWNFKYLNGMALVKASVYQGIEVTSGGHAYNPEMIAKALLRNPFLRIGEAPFAARGRATGGSKAFTLGGVTEALVDFARGYASVSSYRDEVVRAKPSGD